MTAVKNHIKIVGYGTHLPRNTVTFKDQTRYRVVENEETQLSMAVKAIEKALQQAGLTIKDIDCIVSASAVGVQPIPCTAALIHELVAKGLSIPAMDINTTCTSFISALSLMSHLLEAGEYQRILIVSSEVGSLGFNPNQRESFELFSDGAAALIFEATEEERGVISSLQRTWSEGAHDTEIRGGLTSFQPKEYSDATKTHYMFDMNGKKILLLSARKIPEMFKEFKERVVSACLTWIILFRIRPVVPCQWSCAAWVFLMINTLILCKTMGIWCQWQCLFLSAMLWSAI